MAKKKTTKKKAVRRKIPAPVFVPVPMPVEVVLVPVPIEKTKTTTWQQFVDWLKRQ